MVYSFNDQTEWYDFYNYNIIITKIWRILNRASSKIDIHTKKITHRLTSGKNTEKTLNICPEIDLKPQPAPIRDRSVTSKIQDSSREWTTTQTPSCPKDREKECLSKVTVWAEWRIYWKTFPTNKISIGINYERNSTWNRPKKNHTVKSVRLCLRLDITRNIKLIAS